MPYYLFKMTSGDQVGLVRQLDLIEVFDKFRDAKQQVKQLRADNPGNDAAEYRISFAANQLAAEEQLLEKREKPVLMEHER